MKKLSVILAVLLALTMLPAVGASADDGNMLQNADFSDTTGTGWVLGDNTNISETVGRGDKTSLKIMANKKDTMQIVNGISREEDYVLRLYSNRDDGVGLKGNVRIYFFDSADNQLPDATSYILLPGGGTNTATYATTAGTWTLFEYTLLGTSMPEGTAKLGICLRCQSGNIGDVVDGGFYIDDVWFGTARVDVTRNLIENPSFSNLDEAGTFFDGWNQNGNTKAVIGTEQSKNGDDKALKFVGGVDQVTAYVYQTVAIKENKDYVFSLWYYLLKKSGANGKVQFYFYDESDTRLNKDTIYERSPVMDTGTLNTWAKFQIRLSSSATAATAEGTDLEIPANTAKVRIMLNSTRAAGDGGDSFMDDIYFGEVASDITTTDVEDDETKKTISITYNANLHSSKEAVSILPLAALYKEQDGERTLVETKMLAAQELTPGTKKAIELGTFDVEKDGATYILKVFSLDFENAYAPFEEYAIREVYMTP